MRNYRLLALVAITVSISALILAAAVFQSPGSIPPSARSEEKVPQTITVSGEGTVYAEPDMATVQIGVQTNAPTAQEAQQTNAGQTAKVIDQILSLKIERKDIRTSGISLHPVYEYSDGKSPKPSGYQAVNQVSVTVRDLKLVASVLDTSVAAGANNVGGISFGFEDDNRLRQDALAEAVKDARGKADSMAQAAGVRIVGIHSMVEGGVAVPIPMEMARAAGVDAAQTPVMPGQLAIVGHVTVTYTY